MTDEILTLNEAAKLLGIPLHKLQYCIRKGKVKAPHKSLLGSRRFYLSKDLSELQCQLMQARSGVSQQEKA